MFDNGIANTFLRFQPNLERSLSYIKEPISEWNRGMLETAHSVRREEPKQARSIPSTA